MNQVRTNNSSQEIISAIKKCKKIVSFMDASFDYDAYCSLSVMKTLLTQYGIQYDTFFCGLIPDVAKKVVGDYSIKELTDPNSIDYNEYDAMIYLDTGTPNHLDREYMFQPPKNIVKINIDHHYGNTYYGDLNYIFSDESCTCQVLVKLFSEVGIKISEEQKKKILLALLSDTGYFQYDSTRPEDLKFAAEMWEKGLDYHSIIHAVTFNDSYDNLKIRGLVYNNLKIDYEHKFAYSHVSQKELSSINLTWEDVLTPPTNDLMKISNLKFVFLVIEQKKEGIYYVSLRSGDRNYDVASIAEKFGGGGHKVAAGTNVKATNMEEAINLIIATARQLENERS